MHRLPLLVLTTVLSLGLQAQFAHDQTRDILRHAPRQDIGSYLDTTPPPVADDEIRVLLHVGYNDDAIIDALAALRIATGDLRSITLYYSDFPKDADLDALNGRRIDALIDLLQGMGQTAPTDRWRIVRQTNCTSREEAHQLFHGFEIVLRMGPSEDMSALDIPVDFDDFVIDSVMDRNAWTDMLIVCDMTGSMNPYIAQLFLWLQLNELDDRIKQFVFFNDGDTKRDDWKEVGRTGGIYQTRSNDYDRVNLLANQCRRSGGGGDVPENDLEAVWKGMLLCPDCREHILIADNNSPVRDLALLARIEKPIRIIVCGATDGVNAQYLTIARRTGGSVHTIAQDIDDLIDLNEGETIVIDGASYVIQDGRFVAFSTM